MVKFMANPKLAKLTPKTKSIDVPRRADPKTATQRDDSQLTADKQTAEQYKQQVPAEAGSKPILAAEMQSLSQQPAPLTRTDLLEPSEKIPTVPSSIAVYPATKPKSDTPVTKLEQPALIASSMPNKRKFVDYVNSSIYTEIMSKRNKYAPKPVSVDEPKNLDVYNLPGSLLCADVGLSGWSDENPAIVRLMQDNTRYETRGRFSEAVLFDNQALGFRSASMSDAIFLDNSRFASASIETQRVKIWNLKNPTNPTTLLASDSCTAAAAGKMQRRRFFFADIASYLMVKLIYQTARNPRYGVTRLAFRASRTHSEPSLLVAGAKNGSVYLWTESKKTNMFNFYNSITSTEHVRHNFGSVTDIALGKTAYHHDRLFVGQDRPFDQLGETGKVGSYFLYHFDIERPQIAKSMVCKVHVWDVANPTPETIQSYDVGPNLPASIALSATSGLFAIGVDGCGFDETVSSGISDGLIRFFDTRSPNVNTTRSSLSGQNDLLFSPCDRFIAVAGEAFGVKSIKCSLVEVFDIRSLKSPLMTLKHEDGETVAAMDDSTETVVFSIDDSERTARRFNNAISGGRSLDGIVSTDARATY
eukprot:jgi/Hompol1/6765/HPOL_002369-RA